MSKRKIPQKVLNAKKRGDKEALSQMGKAGARKRLENEFYRSLERQRLLEDAQAHAEATRPGWDDEYQP